MSKLASYGSAVKEFSENQIQKYSDGLNNLLNEEIEKESHFIEQYVDNLRRLNPGIADIDLVNKIVSRRSLKSGGVGAVAGLPGIIFLPITLPADMYLSYKIQIRMVLSIAYIYGWDIKNPDVKTDVLLVIGGQGMIDALAKTGIVVGKEFAKKSVDKYITREVMKKINKFLSRKIITKAGQKSLTSFTKLVPIVGAPIGGTINWLGARTVGNTAKLFYKG